MAWFITLPKKTCPSQPFITTPDEKKIKTKLHKQTMPVISQRPFSHDPEQMTTKNLQLRTTSLNTYIFLSLSFSLRAAIHNQVATTTWL